MKHYDISDEENMKINSDGEFVRYRDVNPALRALDSIICAIESAGGGYENLKFHHYERAIQALIKAGVR